MSKCRLPSIVFSPEGRRLPLASPCFKDRKLLGELSILLHEKSILPIVASPLWEEPKMNGSRKSAFMNYLDGTYAANLFEFLSLTTDIDRMLVVHGEWEKKVAQGFLNSNFNYTLLIFGERLDPVALAKGNSGRPRPHYDSVHMGKVLELTGLYSRFLLLGRQSSVEMLRAELPKYFNIVEKELGIQGFASKVIEVAGSFLLYDQ
ncbi:MAG: hypothetical protein NTX79_06620 [Candidatus Micrarchaeota archaeon]|nr:hypothetical protein [Candidatus Micrarchaeota archaeon]